MEVRLKPDLEAKLSRLATEQGRDRESIIIEAVERLLTYDEWFAQRIEKGISEADRGEFVEHEDLGKLIDQRFRG